MWLNNAAPLQGSLTKRERDCLQIAKSPFHQLTVQTSGPLGTSQMQQCGSFHCVLGSCTDRTCETHNEGHFSAKAQTQRIQEDKSPKEKGWSPSRDNKPAAAKLNGKASINTDPRGIIPKRGNPEICLHHNDLGEQICAGVHMWGALAEGSGTRWRRPFSEISQWRFVVTKVWQL